MKIRKKIVELWEFEWPTHGQPPNIISGRHSDRRWDPVAHPALQTAYFIPIKLNTQIRKYQLFQWISHKSQHYFFKLAMCVGATRGVHWEPVAYRCIISASSIGIATGFGALKNHLIQVDNNIWFILKNYKKYIYIFWKQLFDCHPSHVSGLHIDQTLISYYTILQKFDIPCA